MNFRTEDNDTYSLVITRRDASEVLLLPSGAGWLLPQAEVPSRERPAGPLVKAVACDLQLDVYCLFAKRVARSYRDEASSNWAVLEALRHNGPAPAGTQWAAISTISEYPNIVDAESCQEALQELNQYASGEGNGPFGKPGWLRELFSWAQEQIDPLGMRLTGSFQQLNASPTFSLIRMATEDSALWFKATGAPNEHELAIAVTLARLFPGFVPRLIGVHSRWNGWLAAEAACSGLDEISDIYQWEKAAVDLANLQIASIGKCSELLDGKCRDLRLRTVAESIDAFCDRMAELMALQEKKSPPPLTKSELASLREALGDGCELLGRFGLPDTLGHMDCNPGNILVSQDHCVFVDWAEGCVSHPFLTFEHLREHMTRSKPAVTGDAWLTAAYLRPWESFFPLAELRRAMAAAPLLAAFVYAISSDAWRSGGTVNNQAAAGYLRSLARRMYREAVEMAARTEPCLD